MPEFVWEVSSTIVQRLHEGKCTRSSCDYWHPPECQVYKTESECNFADGCSFAHRQVEGQPCKKPKKDGDKSAVARLKNARQLGCVFQDTEPPESSSTFRKSPKVLGPTRQVQFSKATLRHANIRENKEPSLGVIQFKNPHQRGPYAPKFEDRSQEETERQERRARGDAWRLACSILKLKEKDKATLFSSTEVWCLPAPSVIKPEEREFVVDSGASMHMLNRKDLNSAELETVSVCKNPTDDGCHSQLRGANKRRGNSVCQRIGIIRDINASRTWKTLRRSRIFPRVEFPETPQMLSQPMGSASE